MGEEKSEGQILAPGVEVAGLTVKPWTFDQFFAMVPDFVKAASILKEKDISFKEFEQITENPERLLSLLYEVGPVTREIVAKTVDMKPEEVGKMEFDRVISIALVILIQNAERVKNFFGLGKTALSSLKAS